MELEVENPFEFPNMWVTWVCIDALTGIDFGNTADVLVLVMGEYTTYYYI